MKIAVLSGFPDYKDKHFFSPQNSIVVEAAIPPRMVWDCSTVDGVKLSAPFGISNGFLLKIPSSTALSYAAWRAL